MKLSLPLKNSSGSRLLFILILCLFTACKQQIPSPITITCHIQGIPDSAKVILLQNEGQLGRWINNGYFKNGICTFTYTPDSTAVFPLDLGLYGDSLITGRLSFYAAPGITRITGKNDFINNWRIQNKTPEQKELNRMLDVVRPEAEHFYRIKAEIYKLYGQNKYDSPEMDSLKKLKEQKQLLLQEAQFAYLKQLEKFGPATLAEFNRMLLSGLKYSKTLEPRIEEARALSGKLTADQKESRIGEEILAILFPPRQTGIGDTLPETLLYDTEGNPHRLSDFRGKYIILDFWSGGCGPCIMAGAEILRIREKYKDQITFISISTDYEKAWKEASRTYHVSWTNLSDYKGWYAGFCSHFTINGVPYFMIAGPDGKILSDWSGYSDGIIAKKADRLLNSQSGINKISD